MKTVQYFSDEYLEHCRKLSPTQIARFLEDYRVMLEDEGESKLISVRIPSRLLDAFKRRSAAEGVKYQAKIKTLMREYLKS
jgi:predicted DNA binding CopG/RHH family protein